MGGESIGEKRIKGESVDLVCSCYSGSIHGLYCGCRCDSLCPSGVFNLALAATTQAGGHVTVQFAGPGWESRSQCDGCSKGVSIGAYKSREYCD